MILLSMTIPVPAAAQAIAPAPAWNPAGDYVIAGQDEPGYRAWIAAQPARAVPIREFAGFLWLHGVGTVVPTWQLLRTASDWSKCNDQPFEIPPAENWGNLVETLNYVRAHVIPVIGPVEAVSVYRNPVLNACAGGADESTHRHLFAVDLVPLRPTSREAMIRGLCAIHAWRGGGFDVGMGFYRGLRFHVDSKKFRKWGTDGSGSALVCTDVLADLDARAAANRAAAAVVAATINATPAAVADKAPGFPPVP